MKQLKSLSIYLLYIVLITMLGVSFFDLSTTIGKSKIENTIKYIDSSYLTYEVEIEEVIEEEIVEIEVEEETTIKEEVIEEPGKIEEKQNEVVVLETLIGKMSGYGPDCYGCTSNKTANGTYVGEGNIYYEDPTYGTVRILAGDKKYPFHTIVRITNSKASIEPILGIVLDRGGAIGIGKQFLFDLLYASESDAETIGVSNNVTFEILRLGS